MLARTAGAWDKREMIQASWQTESLGVMLWALQILDELPSIDEQFDPREVFKVLPFFGGTRKWISQAHLRPTEEIDKQREVAEMWHWRSRTLELERSAAEPPPGMTYQELIAASAENGHKDGYLDPPVDADFPVFGKAFGSLSHEELGEVIAVIIERHMALNWLCGYSEDGWDETPLDT